MSYDRASLRGLVSGVLDLGGDENPGPMPFVGTYREVVEMTGREAPRMHNRGLT